MLGPHLSAIVDLFARFILHFELLFEIFQLQPHDPPTLLVGGTLAKMNTPLA